jgi:predicted DNA-binding antitoxin AbrB/MazE fold protein
MNRVAEAIYEGGVLRPLEELDLPEYQRVLIEIRLPADSTPDSRLAEWHRVYEGLSDAEIAEVETIVLDRGHFSQQDRALPGRARL